MNKSELQEWIALSLADEMEQLLEYNWSEMVWDAINKHAAEFSDEEKEEMSASITWTLIDEKTGKDLLGGENIEKQEVFAEMLRLLKILINMPFPGYSGLHIGPQIKAVITKAEKL